MSQYSLWQARCCTNQKWKQTGLIQEMHPGNRRICKSKRDRERWSPVRVAAALWRMRLEWAPLRGNVDQWIWGGCVGCGNNMIVAPGAGYGQVVAGEQCRGAIQWGVFLHDLYTSCGLISSTFCTLASEAKEGAFGFQSITSSAGNSVKLVLPF